MNLIILQILEQHIMAVLPTLKSHINAQLVAVAKEHATYGEFVESKVCIPIQLISMLRIAWSQWPKHYDDVWNNQVFDIFSVIEVWINLLWICSIIRCEFPLRFPLLWNLVFQRKIHLKLAQIYCRNLACYKYIQFYDQFRIWLASMPDHWS